MPQILALVIFLCIAAGARAVDTYEQSVTCPIDGHQWKQRIAATGTPRGIRLDTRQLGDVTQPPTLPQCPKCRFVIFNDKLPAPVVERLRPFILGDYRFVAAKNPPYSCLAHIQEFLKAPGIFAGQSHLFASWESEARESIMRRHLIRSLEAFNRALTELAPDDKERVGITLLCGELERRLGQWDDAAARFKGFRESKMMEEHLVPIVERQMKFITARDSAPHAVNEAEEPLLNFTPAKPAPKPAPADAPKAVAKAAPTPKPEPRRIARTLDLSEPLVLGSIEASPPSRPRGEPAFAPSAPPPIEVAHSPTAVEEPPPLPDPTPVASPKKPAATKPKPEVAAKKPEAPVAGKKPEPKKEIVKVEPKPEPKIEIVKAEPKPAALAVEKKPEPIAESAKEAANSAPPVAEKKPEPKKETAKPVRKPEVKALAPAVVAQPGGGAKTKPKLIGAP